MIRGLFALALMATGAGLSSCASYYAPPPPGHVRWCLNHRPGYNPNTNLWVDRFGRLRPCRGPYPY